MYNLILMEHGFNLLCVNESALCLYHRYEDWTLIWAVLEMHAFGDMGKKREQ